MEVWEKNLTSRKVKKVRLQRVGFLKSEDISRNDR